RGQIPEYMVPAAIVILPRLPLTSNGKIDRQNLPEPETALDHERLYVAPRNAVEDTIAGIWSEVLHRDRIGVADDFFQIGGHSLLATQVISRIRRGFGLDVPLRVLFESPTVAGLAEFVDRLQRGDGSDSAPPITPTPRGGALPLSF